jgi:uridine phosphorylase
MNRRKRGLSLLLCIALFVCVFSNTGLAYSPQSGDGENVLKNNDFSEGEANGKPLHWSTNGNPTYELEDPGIIVSGDTGDGISQEWIAINPGHKYKLVARIEVLQGAMSMTGYMTTAGWQFSDDKFFDQKRPADGLVAIEQQFVAKSDSAQFSFRLWAGEDNSEYRVIETGLYDLGMHYDENSNILQNPLFNELVQDELAAWEKSIGASYSVTSNGLKVSAAAQGDGIFQQWVTIIPGHRYVLIANLQADEGEVNFSGYAVDTAFQYISDPFFEQLRPADGQVTLQREFIAPEGATRFSYRLTANLADTEFTITKAGMYDLGSTLPEGQPEGLLQFEENFSEGRMLWDTAGAEGAWKEIDGKLQSLTYQNSSAKLKGTQTNWEDQVISFKFKRIATSGENHMGVRFRVTGSNFSWLLIRDTGLSILHSGTGEQSLYSFPFELDKDYALDLVAQGDELDVYLKSPEQTAFAKVANITGVPVRGGTIEFTTLNIQAAFDDVKISTLEELDFALTSKLSRVGVGDSKQLNVWNETGSANVIWESSNPQVASVSGGMVTGVGRGTAVITVRTNDSMYSDSADVIVTTGPSSVQLNLSSSTLYVGESQEFIATFNPSVVDNTATVWESSNPAVLSLHGYSDRKRAVHGEGVGQSTITIRTVDGGHIASATITVIDWPAGEPDSVLLRLGDKVKDVPDRFFGVNDGLAFNIRPNEPYNTDTFVQMLSDIEFQHIRGPGGMDGNLYLYDEGVLPTNSADQAKMLQVYGADLMNSLLWMPMNIAEADKLTLDKVLKLANDMDKPYIYNLNIIAYTAEEIVEQVTAIKSELDYGRELFVELGNELYDNAYRYPFPTVAEYIAKAKAVAEALRDEHPDVKIGIVSIDQGFVDLILAHGGNHQAPGQSLEDYLATQAGRLSIWNSELLKDQSFFDAVIIHYYNHVEEAAGLSNTKLYDYLYKENELRKITAAQTMALFPGKEAWITEWGLLTQFMFGESDSLDRARYQFAKTEGMAALYVDMFFSMLEVDEITMASYYLANDPQGFGLLQTVGNDEYEKLPAFYALQEIGDLLADYEKYYEIDLSNVAKRQRLQGGTNVQVEIPEVSAWGMGDDEGIQKLIVSNRSDRTVDIELEGYELQPLWSYGGADAMPEFLINPNKSWTDLPTSIPLPDVLEGEAAYHFELEPYAIMVAKAIPSDAGYGASLLKNGDFSQGMSAGNPLHWTKYGAPAYVWNDPGVTVEGDADEGVAQEWISLIPGHTYKFVAQAEVLQGAMNVSAYMVDEQWKFSDALFFDQKRPADGLTTIEKTFIAKSDSTRISIRVLAGENNSEYRIADVRLYDLGPAADLGSNMLKNGFMDRLDEAEELLAWDATGGAVYQVDETGVIVSANSGDGLVQEWIDVIPGHKYLIMAQVEVHQGAMSMLGYGINDGWTFSEDPFFDQKRPADGLVTLKQEYVASATTVRYSFRLLAGENNSSFTVMKVGMYDLGMQQDENANLLQNPLFQTLDSANQLASWYFYGGAGYEVTAAGLMVSGDAAEGVAQEWIDIIPGNKYLLTVQVQVDQGDVNFWGYSVDGSFQFVASPLLDRLHPSDGQVTIRKTFIAPAGASRFSYRLTANESNTNFTVLKAGMYDLGPAL